MSEPTSVLIELVNTVELLWHVCVRIIYNKSCQSMLVYVSLNVVEVNVSLNFMLS